MLGIHRRLAIQVANIPNFFRNVIMSIISNSSMQILWNGVPTQKFKPARGVRQGYPLSRYMFILCMEWLGHNIYSAIDSFNRLPIRLSSTGPPLSHLFFVDDLILFGYADKRQAKIIKGVLDNFCDFLGHKINMRKTNIFSQCVDDTLGRCISNILGYQKV